MAPATGGSPGGSQRSSLKRKASFSALEVAKQRHDDAVRSLAACKADLAVLETRLLTAANIDTENDSAVEHYLARPYVVQRLASWTEMLNRFTQEEENAATELQTAKDADAVSKKRALSVSPSSLTPENLHLARGELKIHDRDSGVARHAAFLAVLQSFNKTGWDEKKRLLIKNCPDFFKESASIEAVETAVNIDSHVEELCASIQVAATSNQMSRSGTLESQEPVFSEKITFFLNRFSVKCKLPLYFAHQYPTAASSRNSGVHSGDIASFSVDQKTDKRKLLGLIEVMKSESANARWQLCGYASEKFSQNTTTSDGSETKLLEHSLLARACMFAGPDDAPKRLLASYFAALLLTIGYRRALLKQPYYYCPFYEAGHIEYIAPKVFRIKDGANASRGDHVAKVFDYGPHRHGMRKPNVKAWKTALPRISIEEKKVSDCTCVSVLVTPWFPGNHTPTQPEHVALLCDQLTSLHEKNMTHGDVLCQNVRFWLEQTDEGDQCKTALIDYDYSHISEYPLFWNTEFAERHPNSESNEDVDKEHYVYSAIAILCMHFTFQEEGESQEPKTLRGEFANSDFTAENHPYLLSTWESKSAADLATWIRKNSSKITAKEPNARSAQIVQTG